jgi:hypothetical protein
VAFHYCVLKGEFGKSKTNKKFRQPDSVEAEIRMLKLVLGGGRKGGRKQENIGQVLRCLSIRILLSVCIF